MNKRFIEVSALLVLFGAMTPLASYAGFFGEHPRYLHAISDMKYARNLIQRPDDPNVMADEHRAVEELNAAINEISTAAREDWKPVNDHPPVDTNLDRPGRLHEAIKILDKAHQDLSQEEDDRNARSLRNQALHHLAVARNFVRKAVGDKEYDRNL
jgi:hypothetical protein